MNRNITRRSENDETPRMTRSENACKSLPLIVQDILLCAYLMSCAPHDRTCPTCCPKECPCQVSKQFDENFYSYPADKPQIQHKIRNLKENRKKLRYLNSEKNGTYVEQPPKVFIHTKFEGSKLKNEFRNAKNVNDTFPDIMRIFNELQPP